MSPEPSHWTWWDDCSPCQNLMPNGNPTIMPVEACYVNSDKQYKKQLLVITNDTSHAALERDDGTLYTRSWPSALSQNSQNSPKPRELKAPEVWLLFLLG